MSLAAHPASTPSTQDLRHSFLVQSSEFLEPDTSTVSGYTISSGSTEWGPGALSGKAIKALGSFVLKTTDVILVRKRLSEINAKVLPNNSSRRFFLRDSSSATDEDWDDLLELSRRGLYPDSVRRQAIQIILARVEGNFDCKELTQTVMKWPQVEIEMLLSELLACLPDDRLDSLERERIHENIRKEYTLSSAVRKRRLTGTFMNFIESLVSGEGAHSAARAALDAGFLQVVLLLGLLSEESSWRPSYEFLFPVHNAGRESLLNAQKALTALATSIQPEIVPVLQSHPFLWFWPKEFDLPLQVAQQHPFSSEDFCRQRSLNLALLPPQVHKMRLQVIEEIIDLRYSGFHVASMSLVFSDLTVLSRDPDSMISLRATGNFLRALTLGKATWDNLRIFWKSTSESEICSVLSKMIAAIKNPSDQLYREYRDMLRRNKEVDPTDYFLEFCSIIGVDRRLIDCLCVSGIAEILLVTFFDIFQVDDQFKHIVTLETEEKVTALEEKVDEHCRAISYEGHDVYNDDLTHVVDVAFISVLSLSASQDIKEINLKEKLLNRARVFLNSTLQDVETWALLFGDTAGGRRQPYLDRLFIFFQLLAALFELKTHDYD